MCSPISWSDSDFAGAWSCLPSSFDVRRFVSSVVARLIKRHFRADELLIQLDEKFSGRTTRERTTTDRSIPADFSREIQGPEDFSHVV